MTLSGSYDWTTTRDGIITRAARICGQLGRGETASANQLSEGASVLNALVKGWQNRGIQLWEGSWIQRTITASSEVLGTDGLNYTCILGHTSATGTNKPITGTNWATYWTQAGTSGVAWANSTPYASAGDWDDTDNLLSIEQAFVRYQGSDTELAIIDRQRYLALPDKGRLGDPEMVWLEMGLTKKFHSYPIPDDTSHTFHFWGYKKLQDFDAGSDNPDFPVSWVNALVFGLADMWGPEFGLSAEKQDRLSARSDKLFGEAQTATKQAVNNMLAYPDMRNYR